MLNKEKISEYEKKLRAGKTELLLKIEKYSEAEDFGDDIDHSEEEANESESFANRMAIAQTMKERVNEIDIALNRIHLGSYGVCEQCGKEISDEVLNLVPESNLCADCKSNR
ncbi:MAG: TraR/DksA C4-type zinc finger protein [Candidatus Liptonbacteria bacterium]|nr:TraR/DksA C4-type zinc finger protein [Candidatus Liptonbacteria bacterium]